MKEIVIRMSDYQYDKTIRGFYIPQEIADIIKNGTPLDDIRQEITEKIEIYTHEFKLDDTPVDYGCRSGLNIALKIIDRHLGESKEAEWKETEPLDDVVELMEGESE